MQKIINGAFNGQDILKGGPDMNFAGGVTLDNWTLNSISSAASSDQAIISISGNYGNIGANFTVSIDSNGLITTDYNVQNPPPPNTHKEWGNSKMNGYEEVGVTYLLSGGIEKISWERKGFWSCYPPNHIGRTRGIAAKAGKINIYRQQPEWDWYLDEKDFYLFGPEDPGGRGSRDFRSMKENLVRYSAILSDSCTVRVESDGSLSARVEAAQNGTKLHICNIVGYSSTALQFKLWYDLPKINSGYSNTVSMRLVEDDIDNKSVKVN